MRADQPAHMRPAAQPRSRAAVKKLRVKRLFLRGVIFTAEIAKF